MTPKAVRELMKDAESCPRLTQWEEEFCDSMRTRLLIRKDQMTFNGQADRRAATDRREGLQMSETKQLIDPIDLGNGLIAEYDEATSEIVLTQMPQPTFMRRHVVRLSAAKYDGVIAFVKRVNEQNGKLHQAEMTPTSQVRN